MRIEMSMKHTNVAYNFSALFYRFRFVFPPSQIHMRSMGDGVCGSAARFAYFVLFYFSCVEMASPQRTVSFHSVHVRRSVLCYL